MGYSIADAERIARLEAATRAARRIVEHAKAEHRAADENHPSDHPMRVRGHGLPRQRLINHLAPQCPDPS